MRIIITLILAFSTFSCAIVLYEELGHIHKGMSIEEVRSVVDNSDYGRGVDLFNDDISLDLYSYNKAKYLVTERYSHMETEYYIFVFLEDKLVYWGTPYQIANNLNPDISNTSVDISKTLKEKYID